MDITNLLSQASTHGSLYLIIIAFFAGMLISFTPCIYPMIPITIGILQTQTQRSLVHNFLSALAYICGIALVYAFLGYLSATTSIMFGAWFAKPWFVGLVILFFLYLALSMFGLYEIYMPRFLLNRPQTTMPHESIVQSFILGLVSGTVASPCLTPALALLLGITAKQASPILGFVTLFSFSLGMGSLLLVIGTFSGALNTLPRAGEWMNTIKTIFGFGMIATCIYFLQPFLGSLATTGGYGLVSGCACVYYFRQAKNSTLCLILGIIALTLTTIQSWYVIASVINF